MPDLPKNITFEITSGTILKTVFIIVGLFLIYFLRDIVFVVLMAIVVASSIEPTTRWLVKRRIPRVFAVVAIYLLMAIIIA